MLGGVDIEVKLPQDLIDLIPQERITGDLLRGHGPRRGNLEALLKYWRPIMRKPGGFRRCIVILANHPELYPLQRICAWLHHETTGKWPNEGNHHGVRRGGGTTGRVLRRAIPGKRKRRRGKSEAGVEIASWRIYRRLGGMATRPIHGSQNTIEYKAARFKQGCKSVPMPGSFEWDEKYPRYAEVETVQDLIDVKLFGGLRGGLVRSHGRSGRFLQSLASFFIPGDMGKYRSPGRSLLWGALTPGGGGMGGGMGVGGGGIGGGGIGGGLTPIAAARALRCPSGYINGGRFTDPKLSNCGGMVFDAPVEGPGAVTDVDREKMTRRLESAQAEDLPDIARDIIINKPQGNPFAVIREAAIQPTTRPNKKRREGSVKDVLAYTSQKKNQTRLVRRDGAVFEPTIGPEELARIDHDNLQEAVYVTSNIPKKGSGLGGDEVRLLTRGVKAIEYSFPEGSVRLERTKELSAATAAKMRIRWGGLRRHAIGSHDPTEAIMRLVKEFQDSLSVKAWFMEIPGANDRIVVYSVTGERKIVARWVFVLYLSLRAPRRPRGTVKPFSMVPPREEEGGPTKSEYWRPERGPFVTVERKSLALDPVLWKEQKNVSSIRINTKWGFEKEDLIDFKAAKFDKVLEDPDLRVKLIGGLRRRMRGRSISGMARRLPKVVPYNPNARDADIDGLVQEGTIWERPKGTRFANLAAGARRAMIGSYLVDAQGERVDYTPGEHDQSPLRKYPERVSPAGAIRREKLRERLGGQFSAGVEGAEDVIERRDVREESVADFTYNEMLQERRRLKRQRALRRVRTQPVYRERRAGRLYDRAERGYERGAERGERDERRRVEEAAAAAQRTAARQARREMSLRFRDENVELDAGVALEDELPSARERRKRVGNLIARQNRERAELNLESPSALRRQRGERVIRRGERREERRTPVLNLRSMSDEDLVKERSAIFRRHYDDMKRRGTYTGIADLPDELEDVERELKRRDLPGPWQDDQGERELRGPSRRDRITAGVGRARRREMAARTERERPGPFVARSTGYGRGPKPPLKPWMIEEDRKRQQRDDRIANLVREAGKRIRAQLEKKSFKKTYDEEKKKVAEERGIPLERADGQMLLFSMPNGLIPDDDETVEILPRDFLSGPLTSSESTGRSRLREILRPMFLGDDADDDANDLSEAAITRLREAGVRVSSRGGITGTTDLTAGIPDPVGDVDLFDLIGDERLGRVLMHNFYERVKRSDQSEAAFTNWLRAVDEARKELEYGGIADPEKDLSIAADEMLERVIRGLPNAFLSTPDSAEGARVLKEVQERLSVPGLWDYGMVPERIREAKSLRELLAVLEKNLHYSKDPAAMLARLKHIGSVFDDADRTLSFMPADFVADLARGDWVDEDTAHTRAEFLKSRLFQLGIAVQRGHVADARKAISDLTTRLERSIEGRKGAEDVPEVSFLPRERGFANLVRMQTGTWVSRALKARTGRASVRRQEEMDRWGWRDYGVDMEGALAYMLNEVWDEEVQDWVASTGELPDGVEERIIEMIRDAFLLGRVITAPHDEKLRFVILADGVDPTDVDFRNIDPKDAAEVVVKAHLNYGQPQIEVSIRGVIYSTHVGALARRNNVLIGGWPWQETGNLDRDVIWRRNGDGSGVVGTADFLSLGLDDGDNIEVRGKGFASVINTHAHMALKAAGVSQINTNASQDGRVVWGRMGYRDHNAERLMVAALESELADYRSGTGSGLILHDRMADEIEELIEAYHNMFVGDLGGSVSLMMAHAILGRDEDGNSQRHPWEDESEADGSQSKYFTWWMRNAPVNAAYLPLDGEYGELLSEAIGEDRDVGLVDPPLTGAPGDGEDPERFEGDEVLNDVRRRWQEYLRTMSGDAKQQLGMLRAMEVDLLGDPNNPDDPWGMWEDGGDGPPAFWVDGLPPPEPPRVVQGYRDRLEDLETLLNSWETPPKEALGMIQLLRAALDDHDRRHAAKEGVEMTPEGVRFRADETSPQRDWNQAARVGGPMYEVDLKRAVTEMTWQEIEQSMNAYIVLDEARDETDSRYRLSEEVPEWTPEEVAYREELKAEFAKREAHPDFAYGTGPNGSRTEEDYRREEEYEHEKDVGKTRGRWEYREGRRNEFRAMSDEEMEQEYERILADNDEVVEAGEYEYGERYDVRPPMAVWKDGVRMEDRKGGMTGFHADDLTDLETVMAERASGVKPFVLRTASPREKYAKMEENSAEIRRLIGQPDSKYPDIEDMHHTHRDTGKPFDGVSIDDEMTVRRLEDENEEINDSFPDDHEGDVDPDTLKEVIGKLTGDGGAQVVDPSEFMPPSSPSEDAERTAHIYEQALRRYQTMNDEDLAIERDGLWRKTMRWREAGHDPKMSDQLKLSAATNEMESRGESLGDEAEEFLKEGAADEPKKAPDRVIRSGEKPWQPNYVPPDGEPVVVDYPDAGATLSYPPGYHRNAYSNRGKDGIKRTVLDLADYNGDPIDVHIREGTGPKTSGRPVAVHRSGDQPPLGDVTRVIVRGEDGLYRQYIFDGFGTPVEGRKQVTYRLSTPTTETSATVDPATGQTRTSVGLTSEPPGPWNSVDEVRAAIEGEELPISQSRGWPAGRWFMVEGGLEDA